MEEFVTGVIRQMTPGAWGIWSLVGMALLGWLKFQAEIKKINSGDDTSLRKDLLERIDTLEKRAVEQDRAMLAERRKCDDELSNMRAEIKGLHRQILEMAKYMAETMGTAVRLPPATKAAMDRLGDME